MIQTNSVLFQWSLMLETYHSKVVEQRLSLVDGLDLSSVKVRGHNTSPGTWIGSCWAWWGQRGLAATAHISSATCRGCAIICWKFRSLFRFGNGTLTKLARSLNQGISVTGDWRSEKMVGKIIYNKQWWHCREWQTIGLLVFLYLPMYFLVKFFFPLIYNAHLNIKHREK